ncbi:hypothetical protein J2X20_001322 [Pelomonas saccharophila]|uniref:Uncharacterized protein n=1 Tax=Roseateles saccharophilus TaxID=304 RepID=A0ABU1YIZ7_ROSSA|nr:hypothetical protein [Roseateles saccharophilus]MDR7268693.1 hypothetical protein [Roseateles saccharophilus]
MFSDSLSPATVPHLPVAADLVDADLDVSLSTPSTLVVHASLELQSHEAMDLALVIPRSRCSGERPRVAALLDAMQAAVARATRGGTLHQPRRVLTSVAGQPHLVAQF